MAAWQLDDEQVIQKPDCVVFTWFYPNSPGYLDFSYRIQSLIRQMNVIVVSNLADAASELGVPADQFIHLPSLREPLPYLAHYGYRVYRILNRLKPRGVVFLHSFFAPIVGVARKWPTAIYWNEHPLHFYPHIPQKRWLLPLLYLQNKFLRYLAYRGVRSCRLVMPIGPRMYDDLLAHGCSTKQTLQIPMGVDASFLAPVEKDPIHEDQPIRLVYTGTISADRGRDIMLNAIAIANSPFKRFELRLVGATPDQRRICERIADNIGVGNCLVIDGRKPGSAIPRVLSKAQIGICIWKPEDHWHYNPPTKLFEYLVSGLPVLASNMPTHTDYVEDGVNGFIFEYTAEDMARALERIWKMRTNLPIIAKRAAAQGSGFLWNKWEGPFVAAVNELCQLPTHPHTT